MIYEVTPLGTGNVPIDFAPPTVAQEVVQNVATILSTMRGTVPYDREFGINPDYIDDPMPVSMARCSADIIEAIRRYEPRCRVESVTFTGNGMEGTLRPVVRVSINE